MKKQHQTPAIEGQGAGWIEITPAAGPSTPEEFAAAAATLTKQALPVETMPDSMHECLAGLKAIQNMRPSDSQGQRRQREMEERLTRHIFNLQNRPATAARRDTSGDMIWNQVRATDNVGLLAVKVAELWRVWHGKIAQFEKQGLLHGAAARQIKRIENVDMGTCADEAALNSLMKEVQHLKSISPSAVASASGFVAESFRAIGGPFEKLLDAADLELAEMLLDAVGAEKDFFNSHGLPRHETAVSRRVLTARTVLHHYRTQIDAFHGRGIFAAMSTSGSWNPPHELCGQME